MNDPYVLLLEGDWWVAEFEDDMVIKITRSGDERDEPEVVDWLIRISRAEACGYEVDEALEVPELTVVEEAERILAATDDEPSR